jgi:hypothetical protein
MCSCSYWQTERQLNKDQLKLKLQLQLTLEKKVKKTFILLPDKSVIMYYDNNIIATPKVWLTTARGAQHVTLDFCGLVLQVQCNKVNFPVG